MLTNVSITKEFRPEFCGLIITKNDTTFNFADTFNASFPNNYNHTVPNTPPVGSPDQPLEKPIRPPTGGIAAFGLAFPMAAFITFLCFLHLP
jgi:hypothetical protein